MLSKVTPYIIVIVVASLLGFITENIWVGLRFGFVDNRGMMAPGLIGYGMAMVGMYILLGTPEMPRFLGQRIYFASNELQIAYYIFMAGVLVSVGEILLGTAVERFCQIEWWNYSSLPLHIGKYTSVFTSIGFGMMITIFMNHIFPYLFSRALTVNDGLIESLVYVLFVLLVVDFIHEAKYMIKNKHINKIWKVDIKEKYIVNHDQVRYIH